MDTIRVAFADGHTETHSSATLVEALLPGPLDPAGLPYLAALVNNDVSSLSYPLTVNSHVRFLTIADAHGWRVYRRSACFLLAKAVHELFPSAEFSVDHSFGPGLYCTFRSPARPANGTTAEEVASIECRMRELVARRVPIIRRKIAFADAVRAFEETGETHHLNLLRFRNPPRVVIHDCEGFRDLAHGPLVPHTGVLDRFALIPYKPGFILQLPTQDDPLTVPSFADQPHLFAIFREHKEWGRILGVTTAGQLNATIADRRIEDFIRTAEALHEKKVARIADEIAAHCGRVRLVLIAGPSASGKTTFAKRLTVQLAVNGLFPVTLGTDDYFVGDERNPRDAQGNPDYEHIEAVDIALFNEHLVTLMAGGEVELPAYNFVAKKREFRGRRLKLKDDQILIVEGIHGLNPRLTHMVEADRKFKIYVSALTQLSIDMTNRISTTDNRLMRRLVRDHRFRNHSALTTLRLWPQVLRGEERWIFPFQREADVAFNSALDYELAVLKPSVEALLMEVKPMHAEYAEARRLSEFLLNFLSTSDRNVPRTSILREYIGGSAFAY